MSFAATPLSLDPAAQARLDAQVEALDRLAEAGLDLVLELRRQFASGPDGSEPLADPAVLADPKTWRTVASVYARLSRAVRLTYAFQARLLKAGPAPAAANRPALGAAPASLPVSTPGQSRPDDQGRPDPQAQAERKVRARNIVDRAIDGMTPDPEESMRLCREAGELLEDREDLGDILGRPFGEVLAYICDQLGLSPDWDAVAQEPWARREAAAGAVFPPRPWWRDNTPAPRGNPGPRSAAAPAPGDLVTGDLVTGDLVTGDPMTGDPAAGHLGGRAVRPPAPA